MNRTAWLAWLPGAIGRRPGALALGMVWASLAFAAPAFAGRDAEMRRHPGFVDGSLFVELAGEDSELVEVSLGPALLRAISRGAADDPEARSVLSGLLGVNAYIVGLENDAARETRAAKLVKDVARHLESSGWERLVRVREKRESVNVYVRNNEETIDGLVVLVFDEEGSEVVFANLVGTIDLARLGEIKGTLDVPGLDALDDAETETGAGTGTPAPPKKRGAKDGGAR
jgi:hypothetical protein